jgi:hypothetical protein
MMGIKSPKRQTFSKSSTVQKNPHKKGYKEMAQQWQQTDSL